VFQAAEGWSYEGKWQQSLTRGGFFKKPPLKFKITHHEGGVQKKSVLQFYYDYYSHALIHMPQVEFCRSTVMLVAVDNLVYHVEKA
jgi:hypothetical protein